MIQKKNDEWAITHIEMSLYEPDDPDNLIVEIAGLYDYLITRDMTNGSIIHKKISKEDKNASSTKWGGFVSIDIRYHSYVWDKEKKVFHFIFNATSGIEVNSSLRYFLKYFSKNGFSIFKFCDANVLQAYLQNLGAKQDWILTVLGKKETIKIANE